MATESVNEMPVNTWIAEANAIAVATDHIGKAKAVIRLDIPRAFRPNFSPIIPVTVTIIFFLNERMIRKAMMKICTISATPYQIAETPVR